MGDLITVIVPIHNADRFLDECIASITRQTYHKLEILLIDNGSTDNSRVICTEWALKDSRIKYIYIEDSDPSIARNKGLDNIHGNYISFVDADDLINEKMIARMLDLLKSNEVDISIVGRYRYHKKISENYNIRILKRTEAIKYLHLDGNYDISAWGKLYKKELFNDIRFQEYTKNEDYYVAYELFYRKVTAVAFYSEQLYYYRPNLNSVTAKRIVDIEVVNTIKRQISSIRLNPNDRHLLPYITYELMRVMVSQINYIMLGDMETRYSNVLDDYLGYLKNSLPEVKHIDGSSKVRMLQFLALIYIRPLYKALIKRRNMRKLREMQD